MGRKPCQSRKLYSQIRPDQLDQTKVIKAFKSDVMGTSQRKYYHVLNDRGETIPAKLFNNLHATYMGLMHVCATDLGSEHHQLSSYVRRKSQARA